MKKPDVSYLSFIKPEELNAEGKFPCEHCKEPLEMKPEVIFYDERADEMVCEECFELERCEGCGALDCDEDSGYCFECNVRRAEAWAEAREDR